MTAAADTLTSFLAAESAPMSLPAQTLPLDRLAKPLTPVSASDLTLLDDSGTAIYAVVGTIDPALQLQNIRHESDLRGVLDNPTSVGIGIKGTTNLGGETFSWANVNLEDISYG
jgi:hypothetical protein